MCVCVRVRGGGGKSSILCIFLAEKPLRAAVVFAEACQHAHFGIEAPTVGPSQAGQEPVATGFCTHWLVFLISMDANGQVMKSEVWRNGGGLS